MDKIKIELINISGLDAAHRAVKKPYRNEKADGVKLLHKVSKILKHESVLEHIFFQFDVDGSSRLELQEHIRHRHASPTVESSRYALKRMVKELEAINKRDYREIESFIYKYTVFPEWMLEAKNSTGDMYLGTLGRRFNQLEGFARLYSHKGADVAKYELIESLRTSFVWTINLRSFLNFIQLRTAKNAHFEIRQIAQEMKDLVSENEEIKNLII
jgi:thymidylate synthase (FAD)